MTEEAINLIVKVTSPNSIIVATTGMTSRELYEIRDLRQENHDMVSYCWRNGHASSIAISIAKCKPSSKVLCLDGDGLDNAHGYLAMEKKKFNSFALNNESHDSVGGPSTIASEINFINIAKACNYDCAYKVNSINDLEKFYKSF